jgi:hypothetical protein
MEYWAVQCGDITKDHERLLLTIKLTLLNVNDPEITCHEVCEFLVKKLKCNGFNIQHKKGYFSQIGWQHSWLELPDDEVIIDVYPWCASGPFMVTTKGLLNPWKHLYIEAEIDIPQKPYIFPA